MFLALAKTTTNIHNLLVLLIFVLGGALNLKKGEKGFEFIEGGNVFKRSFKRDACYEVTCLRFRDKRSEMRGKMFYYLKTDSFIFNIIPAFIALL